MPVPGGISRSWPELCSAGATSRKSFGQDWRDDLPESRRSRPVLTFGPVGRKTSASRSKGSPTGRPVAGARRGGKIMKRVVVDHYGGPEVLRMVEEDDPRPGPGEVRVRVLVAGVSFTDSQLRAGDRIGALTVWGADADRVCLPEAGVVEVPEDLDPAEALSLVFTYMTAYQVLHRTARAKRGETVLVHGAAGRVGTAALELGALAELRLFGTASARDRAAVERLGAVAIDYRNEDFVARVRELTGGEGVDVVLDSLGGPLSLRSFRALRPGGRLVVFGRYATLRDGHKNWPAVIEWYVSVAAVWLWATLSPRRRAMKYQIQKFRDAAENRPGAVGGEPRYPEWFQEDFRVLVEMLRRGEIHPVVAERLPLSEARHAHELLDSTAGTGKLVLVP